MQLPKFSIFSKLPKIKIDFSGLSLARLRQMSDRNKIIFASCTVVVTLFIIGFSYNLISNTAFRDSVFGPAIRPFQAQGDKNKINKELENLGQLADRLTLNKKYYSEYSIKDLEIYPDGWIKRKFSESERRNSLISGKDGDPDKDGLTNKEEYFYGSDPKSSKTLCQNIPNGQVPYKDSAYVCDGRTDKQLVDNSISPLTGLKLDTVAKFTILQQDLSLINSLKEGISKASEEGLDFPELYARTRLIDLSSELDAKNVVETSDTAQNILNYRNFRLSTVDSFLADSGLNTLSSVYTLTQDEQFVSLINKYKDDQKKAQEYAVPKKYVMVHKAFLLIYDKLINLVQYRKEIVKSDIANKEELQKNNMNKIIETMWGYRRVKEETAKADQN
jgi:hypothetical protein